MTARVVLHVTTVPATLGFVRGQVGYCKGRGWEVHALSAPGGALTEFGESEKVVVHTALLSRTLSPMRDLRALAQVAQVLRALKPTVVHAHTPKAGLLSILAAAAVSPSTTRVYQVRGLPHEAASGWRRPLLRACERLTGGLAHRVVCHSPSIKEVVLADGLCAPFKCIMLANGRGNGVDAVERWNPAHVPNRTVQALRADLGIPADAPIVGYIGRLARDKGIVELEAAWQMLRAKHPAAHLLILGAPDARDPVSTELLGRMRANASVHLCGRQPDPAPYYALMDVLVLPSYREGMPNVALEAAAMAVPVVAARVTGCVDAVQHGVTGMLFEPRSATALVHALDQYLSSAELRDKHGAAGRARMLREFQPEPLWQAWYAEYEKMLRQAKRSPSLSPVGLLARRAFDVVGALSLLALTAPVVAAVALAVRIDLGAPVIFKQTRPGRYGIPFTLHKFRTMRDQRGDDGELLPAAARLTRLGRWLRSTSLDELPELWDVLRGRMSLVGPRPLLMEYLPRFTTEQMRRHNVLPGITGWAQVHGRNATTWEERLRLDVWYVDHASPRVDARILASTLPQVFARRNITPRDHPIMEPFHGA